MQLTTVKQSGKMVDIGEKRVLDEKKDSKGEYLRE